MRRHVLTFVLITAVLLTAGCRDSRHIPMANGRPQVTIMVGGLEKIIYLPAMLTQQLGHLKNQDIDVTMLSAQ